VQASVRIRGVRESIALRETAPGVYVGRYTLKRVDRVGPDSEVRAMLRHGNRTDAANYELGEAMGTPPVAVVPPPPPARAPDPLRIERFGMVPIDRIEPGAELQFSLEGMPGADASVDLPGVERDLRLRETRPGHYEGNYTIRRSDDFNPNRPMVATLRSGDRVVTANLNLQVARPGADNRPPNAAAGPAHVPIRILNHSNNDRVGSGPTLVQGQTVPNASVAVTVNAVAPVANLSQELLSRTLQADANGNFAFSFVPQFPIPGTRYDITLVSTRGNLRDDATLVLVQR
jgi:hypothetical protein